MDGGGMGRSMGNLSSTQGNANWGGGSGNATFGDAGFGQQQQGGFGGSSVDRFGLTRRGSGGNMNIGGSGGGGGGAAPGMPRTATALESMLLSGVTPGSSGGGGNASFGAAAPGGNFGGLRRN